MQILLGLPRHSFRCPGQSAKAVFVYRDSGLPVEKAGQVLALREVILWRTNYLGADRAN